MIGVPSDDRLSAGGVPSLSSAASAASTKPKNKTNIKPTWESMTREEREAHRQSPQGQAWAEAKSNLSNIGAAVQPGQSTLGSPTPKRTDSLTSGAPSLAQAQQASQAATQRKVDPVTGVEYSGLSDTVGDYADLTVLSDRQLYDILRFGPNAPTKERREAIIAAAAAEQNRRSPTTTAPTSSGMGAGGGQAGVQVTAPAQAGPVIEDFPGNDPASMPGGQQGAPGPSPQFSGPAGGPTPGINDNNEMYDAQGNYIGPGSPGYMPPGQRGPGNTNPDAFVGSLGDGNTNFNPGGANPDGDNSTVPRGSRDGTAPSVYSIAENDPDLIAFLDQDARDGIEALVNNTRAFSDMPGWQQEKVLNSVQGLVSQGRFDWNKLASNGAFRREYISRFGDPVQSSVGATDNTVNPDGSVQGQFEGERGGAFQAIADNAASMDDMDVERAAAATAAENARAVGQDELSSERMANILGQDSALMQLAAQDGVEMANRAGLRNSSLAAGAQQAAMARAAQPLALQEADVFNRTGMQNQTLESARREANAAREQQGNQFNASSENAATSQEFGTEAQRREANAARETQTAITNAGMANDMTNADRQRVMQYELQQLAGDQDFAKQQLAAQTAADVANIEGSYKQLISENDTAARMFDSYYQSVQSAIGNAEFTQQEAQGRVNAAREEFEAGMEMILGFESFDLQNPGVGGDIPESGRPAADQTGVPNGFTRMEFPWGISLLPTNNTGVAL